MTEHNPNITGEFSVRSISAARAGVGAPEPTARRATASRRGRKHTARKSRYLAGALSLAAASGLTSGMWVQAAASSTAGTAAVEAVPAVTTSVAQSAPEQVVYLVVRRPATSAATERLRTAVPAPTTTTTAVPDPVVAPALATPPPAPVTKSHASK